MNDLFSTSSFKKKYTDLKHQVHHDDMESGMASVSSEVGKESVNLNTFFEEVEGVKEDIRGLVTLFRRLQDSNEESKTVHNANTVKQLRARMDSDVDQVLCRAKIVKAKLEALDCSNVAHRTLPGCGPGTSADRTRTSIVGGISKKLKDLMDDFQGLRTKISVEYKETVGRRYFTVTGEQANEQTIETLISTGESETLLHKAIQEEQGRGQVLDAISEIQERHDAVKEMEKSLLDLHQVFLDMAALVDTQGQQLNDIESHVAHANSFVRRGTVELETAKEYQKSSRKWTCIAISLGAGIVIVIVIPILTSFTR